VTRVPGTQAKGCLQPLGAGGPEGQPWASRGAGWTLTLDFWPGAVRTDFCVGGLCDNSCGTLESLALGEGEGML
jgi:hypothetical protein